MRDFWIREELGWSVVGFGELSLRYGTSGSGGMHVLVRWERATREEGMRRSKEVDDLMLVQSSFSALCIWQSSKACLTIFTLYSRQQEANKAALKKSIAESEKHLEQLKKDHAALEKNPK